MSAFARPTTPEEAISEWIVRQLHRRGETASHSQREWGKVTRDDIRDVRFAVEDGWPGTDATPGDPDYPVVRFELHWEKSWRSQKDGWIEDTVGTPDPVTLIRECLALFEEGDDMAPAIDPIIRRLDEARWGGSREPAGASPNMRVFTRWVRDARMLGAEVKRLRYLVSILRARGVLAKRD